MEDCLVKIAQLEGSSWQATSRVRWSKHRSLMKGNLEAVENYCVGRQFSSFLYDYKTVFLRN
jgi:hypothetical protein